MQSRTLVVCHHLAQLAFNKFPRMDDKTLSSAHIAAFSPITTWIFTMLWIDKLVLVEIRILLIKSCSGFFFIKQNLRFLAGLGQFYGKLSKFWIRLGSWICLALQTFCFKNFQFLWNCNSVPAQIWILDITLIEIAQHKTYVQWVCCRVHF